MKRIFIGLTLAAMLVALGFGSIALLTRLSDIDDEPVASTNSDEFSADELLEGSEFDFGFTEDDCLPSELWDSQEEVCYYECDTDAECAQIEAQLDTELESIYDQSAGNTDFSEGAPANAELVTFTVSGSEITPTSGDEVGQNASEIWQLFTAIAPVDFISDNIIRYETYSDEDDSTAAYVNPSQDNPSKWILGVNLAASYPDGQLERQETLYTLVHEFAHILTLEVDQVPPDVSFDRDGQSSCATFYTGEGCSIAKAYINQFFEKFWKEIYDELPGEDASEANLTAFYEKYQERFVTDYAATNPGEDIAESFAAFVLKPKPDANSVADEKVRFFYDFSELVRLREQIRVRLRT